MAIEHNTMTADELLKMPHNGLRYELVKGELFQMSPAGSRHGLIAARICASLLHFIEQNNLGNVYAAKTGFMLATNPDTVRAPDASFVTRERAEEMGETTGFFPGPPDLAVEVISPIDTYTEVADKALDWLRSGTQLVIVLDPAKKNATIYRDLDDIVMLTSDQTLEIPDLLPNWSLALKDLFK